MEQTKLKQIDVIDYSVTFYGGTEDFSKKHRIMISLYGRDNNLFGYVRFFENPHEIESDKIDENGLVQINLPSSHYHNLIYTLRSNRPIQVIFQERCTMLAEMRFMPIPPPNITDKSSVN